MERGTMRWRMLLIGLKNPKFEAIFTAFIIFNGLYKRRRDKRVSKTD
jgi:hypothetical protein